MQSIGKYMVVLGAFIVVAGLILWLFGNKLTPIAIGRLGNLPGDIKIERENFRLYFPITTMILFSVVLTIGMWIIRRLLN